MKMLQKWLQWRCALVFCACFFTTTVDFHAQVTIDSLVYHRGTFFGNATNDSYLLHMTVDAQGFVYGTGLCLSIPTTAGAYRTTPQGSYDAMVFKLDPTMKNLIWATYIGGSGIEAGGGITVNSSGEVFLTGYTQSANFPVTVGSDAAYLASGAVNYFALKLSSDGSTLLYSRILGRGSPITQQTQSASKGAHIAINPAGEAYIFSHTNSSSYQITANAYQNTIAGSSDFVLTKLSSTGAIQYSTFFGGSSAETSYDVCYANGKVYCTGTTASAALPLRSGKVPDAAGDCAVFIADDAGTVHPRKCYVYGSSGADLGYSVHYDSHANRICLTGIVGSVMPYNTALQSGQTTGGFVAAIDTALTNFMYVTMLGFGVVPTSVAARTTNSTAYVAGYVSGTLPVSSNAYQASPRGSLDGLMISVDSLGSGLKYGTYMGGSNSDYSAAKVLLVDRGCVLRVIFGITTHSRDFPSTTNTYQPQKLNGLDDQPALAMFSTFPTSSWTITSKPCSKEYTFTFNTSCPYTNLVWTFGDGTTVTAQNPVTHIFPRFGTFKVSATALSIDGDTIRKSDNVNIGPTQVVDAGPDQIVCKKNSQTQLNGSGAVFYRWSPGKSVSDSTIPNPIIRPTTTTMYYLYGRDAFGCESYDSVIVIVKEIFAKVERDTAICEGRFAILRASGGTYYSWLPSSGINKPNAAEVLASPQTTTSYSVVVFDGTCFDTATVTVRIIPRPRLKMAAVPSICANTPVELGVSVTITGSSDSDVVSYRWSPTTNINNPNVPNPIVTLSKDAWYKVTVTTKYGCSYTDSVHIVMQTKLKIAVSADTTICSGGSVQLKANGAAEYRWTGGGSISDSTSNSPIVQPNQTTTYTVIGRGGMCLDTQRVTIRVQPRPAGMKARGDTTVCTNERVHVWVDNADTVNNSYTWSPANDFENPNGASAYLRTTRPQNTYSVMIRNKFGCVSYDTVHVRVENALDVKPGPNVSGCVGEAVSLKIASDNDDETVFSWTPNDGVWNPTTKEYRVILSTSKTYAVHAQRGACFGQTSMSVVAKPNPDFTLSSDTAICYGTELSLAATSTQPGIQYRWLNGTVPDTNIDNAFIARPKTRPLLKNLSLTVEATLDGCVRTKIVNIKVHALAEVVAPPDTLLCSGEWMTLRAQSSNTVSVRWEPSTGLSDSNSLVVRAAPTQTTRYTITGISADGCTSALSYCTIRVKPRVGIQLTALPINENKVLKPGQTTSISVRVHADSSIQSRLNFDVVFNANIFDVRNYPYTDRNGKRFVHMTIPSYTFFTADTLVMKIEGQALQANPSSSDVWFDNIDVDSARCPNFGSNKALISIGSCFSAGRNVELATPTQATLIPHPIGDVSTLRVLSSERGELSIHLYNMLGRKIRTWTAMQSDNELQLPLSFQELDAGVYTMVINSAASSTSLPVLKSHEK